MQKIDKNDDSIIEPTEEVYNLFSKRLKPIKYPKRVIRIVSRENTWMKELFKRGFKSNSKKG